MNPQYPINCPICGRLIQYVDSPRIRTAICIICQNADNPQNLPPLIEVSQSVPVIPELQAIADAEFGVPEPPPIEEPKTLSKSRISNILKKKKLVPTSKKRK